MKTIRTVVSLLLITWVLLPMSGTLAAAGGVNDLRGRWNVEAFFGEEPLTDVVLYVNDMRESTLAANTYYANGCMRTTETNAFMPLSIRAVYDPQANAYDISIYSTVVPSEGEPFVIRFTGMVGMGGESVKDDAAGGAMRTGFGNGEWTAVHHDRRVTKCPSVRDIGLGFQGDVYTHLDVGETPARISSVYEAYTIIVSSGMLVEAPDGSRFIAQEYTDIFSPDVDFVGRFRFVSDREGQPISGGIYKFTLLDIFGDPIPGTESTDIWMGCNQTAPINLTTALVPGSSVTLGWDAVPDVLGEFQPSLGIGFYQIGIDPFHWGGMHNYGSNWIQTPQHVLPWNPFEPGSAGSPNGYDYGVSLSEFADGAYQINLFAFSFAQPRNGGFGLECDVQDSSHKLVMTKQGNDLTFNRIGTISGYVYDTLGNPLGGIGVDTEFGGYGTCTDENGFYILRDVPFGSYNIAAGRQFCGEHPFMEQLQNNIQVGATNVNFHLEEAVWYPSVLHVVPAHPEIHGHLWNPDLPVTIYVDEDDDLANGFLYTETKNVNDEPTWCIAPCFDISIVPELPNGILPGYVVTMMNAEITRIVHITSLTWEGTNIDEDTVFGLAEAGTWVEVTSHGPISAQRLVQADENGIWVADFSIPGVQSFEQDVIDLTPGFHGRSIQFENPDNGTLAYWHIEEPAP